MIRRFFFTLFAVCFTAAILPAQTEPAAPAPSFRIINLAETDYADLSYELAGKPVPLLVSAGGFSPAYATPAGKTTLTFFRDIPPPPNAPAGTKPVRQIMAEFKLDPACRQHLVLMSTAPAGAPRPIAGLAVPEIFDRHTFGTARIINLSDFALGFNFGKETLTGGAHTADLVAPFPSGVTKVGIAINDAQTWKPVFYTQRRLTPFTRIYTILVNRTPTTDNPEPVRPFILFEYDRAAALAAREK